MEENNILLSDSSDQQYHIDLINTLNAYYMGTLYLGTPASQKADVIFDTGSPWLVVSSLKCTNCESHAYDADSSSSATKKSDQAVQQQYGSANLVGWVYEDDVCMVEDDGDSPQSEFADSLLVQSVEDSCVDKFNFISIVS